ncbi:phosphatidylglycerophosphatase A, partial [Candidatus Aerophobetes bacterium]
MRKVHVLVATGLGIGNLPWAPGTLATLVAVILYLVFRKILPEPLSYGIMLVLFSGMA